MAREFKEINLDNAREFTSIGLKGASALVKQSKEFFSYSKIKNIVHVTRYGSNGIEFEEQLEKTISFFFDDPDNLIASLDDAIAVIKNAYVEFLTTICELAKEICFENIRLIDTYYLTGPKNNWIVGWMINANRSVTFSIWYKDKQDRHLIMITNNYHVNVGPDDYTKIQRNMLKDIFNVEKPSNESVAFRELAEIAVNAILTDSDITDKYGLETNPDEFRKVVINKVCNDYDAKHKQ